MGKAKNSSLLLLASLGLVFAACGDAPSPAGIASGLCSEMGQTRAASARMREQALSALKTVGDGARMMGAEAEENAQAKLTVQRLSWQNAGEARAWCAAAKINDTAMSRLAVTLEQAVGRHGDAQALRNLRTLASSPQGEPSLCEDIEELSELSPDYEQRVITPVKTWMTERNQANDALVDACRSFAQTL